jgi:cyclopropane-fatty-acyl-phospholipid synthase
MKLDPIFVRMWEFYLLYSASGFRERKTQLWQVVMTKKSKARYDAAN